MKAISTPHGHKLVPDDTPFSACLASVIILNALQGHKDREKAEAALKGLCDALDKATACHECGGDLSSRCLSCDNAGQ
jgi:hypothetical protein